MSKNHFPIEVLANWLKVFPYSFPDFIPFKNPPYPTIGSLLLIWSRIFSSISPVSNISLNTCFYFSSMYSGSWGGLTYFCGGLYFGLKPWYPTTGILSMGGTSSMDLGCFLYYSILCWLMDCSAISRLARSCSAAVISWFLLWSGLVNSFW